MKWKLLEEANTPSDGVSIDASFNKDVSDEKFTPTVEFMRSVYRKMNKELFVQIGKTNDGIPEIFKILAKNKDKCLSILKERGYKRVAILSSSNPISVELKPIRPSNGMNIRAYHLDDGFEQKYGPFKKVETLDLESMLLESNEDNDETLTTLRSIKGVVYARKIGKHTHEICIA